MKTLVVSSTSDALTAKATTVETTSWSDVALETAKHLTISGRLQLEADGVIGVPREVQITGETIDSAEKALLPPDDDHQQSSGTTTSKLIHFQRHGQGFHNVICEMWRELGKPVNLSSHDPTLNPMKRLEVKDSPLTEVGRQQCLTRNEQASFLNPEIVVVSPLLRTLQTAELSWGAHRERVPWVAHEGCREDLGVLVCNQRQTTSQIQLVYPDVDFSLLDSEEDTLFMADRHETALEKADRVYEFLLYLRSLSQREIAVVTHSAWLFNMCNAVMEIPDDNLSSWFLTSEIRSMRVSFADRSKHENGASEE